MFALHFALSLAVAVPPGPSPYVFHEASKLVKRREGGDSRELVKQLATQIDNDLWTRSPGCRDNSLQRA